MEDQPREDEKCQYRMRPTRHKGASRGSRLLRRRPCPARGERSPDRIPGTGVRSDERP
jgi:hypothetical protein